MKELTREEWMFRNQNYLMAEVNLIKAKLLVYEDSLTNEDSSDDLASVLAQAENDLDQLKKELQIKTRLESLVELFQLSVFEKNILLLGVGIELDASLGKLISRIQDDFNHSLPNFSLALSLFSEAHWSALSPEAPLRYWQLINLNKTAILTNSTFSVDEIILHYLTGIDQLDTRLSSFVSLIQSNTSLVPSHQKIAKQITQYLSQSSSTGIPPLIQLEGNSTEDKMTIIATSFAQYNLACYILPVQLLPSSFQELTQFLRLWNRTTILNQCVLFIDGKQLESLSPSSKNHVEHILEKIRGIVVISTAHKFREVKRAIHSIKVEKPLKQEQKVLWKEQLGKIAKNLDGEIGNLVTQFNLDGHTINRLAQLALLPTHSNGSAAKKEPSIQERIWKSCCNYTRPNLSSLAHRIEPIASWEDLVLPESQKKTLKEICIHVQQRQKVYEEWGFGGKSNRGLGISVLFSGESGTGKTMASEVLANALQLELYRIDLSQVVNKYIGETEKNLKRIFDAAEESGAILLFDEADALFGKRSEVKDSHDRYSNIEVSFLLQKMEAYRGLAILTTNMRNALDKAFLRRIRFVIEFPFPDVELREEIWKKIFPKQTPTKALVLKRLANLNIAGGNIRNIALNASFAAAHKNQPVSMEDIHQAARKEYLKLEKHMSPSEYLI